MIAECPILAGIDGYKMLYQSSCWYYYTADVYLLCLAIYRRMMKDFGISTYRRWLADWKRESWIAHWFNLTASGWWGSVNRTSSLKNRVYRLMASKGRPNSDIRELIEWFAVSIKDCIYNKIRTKSLFSCGERWLSYLDVFSCRRSC